MRKDHNPRNQQVNNSNMSSNTTAPNPSFYEYQDKPFYFRARNRCHRCGCPSHVYTKDGLLEKVTNGLELVKLFDGGKQISGRLVSREFDNDPCKYTKIIRDAYWFLYKTSTPDCRMSRNSLDEYLGFAVRKKLLNELDRRPDPSNWSRDYDETMFLCPLPNTFQSWYHNYHDGTCQFHTFYGDYKSPMMQFASETPVIMFGFKDMSIVKPFMWKDGLFQFDAGWNPEWRSLYDQSADQAADRHIASNASVAVVRNEVACC